MQLKITTAVALLACALWLGGMIALGAIAAPTVFGIVPAPHSADAMTVVFRRFDKLAMSCAAILALTEVVRARLSADLLRVDLVRGAAVLVAGLLAIAEGMVLAPRIEELHRGGAIRGLGEAGEALESAHHLAELAGKTEALLLAVVIVLLAFRNIPTQTNRLPAAPVEPDAERPEG
ncbi:MAG: hypothetical protein JWM74_5138 [Myxococcaceae bacterium]|jgi:uncharacterized membrane protein|nr:hypothetical protein [Myxococcaceae bacterium]